MYSTGKYSCLHAIYAISSTQTAQTGQRPLFESRPAGRAANKHPPRTARTKQPPSGCSCTHTPTQQQDIHTHTLYTIHYRAQSLCTPTHAYTGTRGTPLNGPRLRCSAQHCTAQCHTAQCTSLSLALPAMQETHSVHISPHFFTFPRQKHTLPC